MAGHQRATVLVHSQSINHLLSSYYMLTLFWEPGLQQCAEEVKSFSLEHP